MIEKTLVRIDTVSDNLLSNLENRNVALWVRTLPKDPPSPRRACCVSWVTLAARLFRDLRPRHGSSAGGRGEPQ